MDLASDLAKIILFILNFGFWLIGLFLIVISSIFLRNDAWKFSDETVTNKYVIIGILVTGTIMFLIAFAGCCGAIKESRFLLRIYVISITVIIVVQITIGIIAMIKKQKIDKVLRKEMKYMFLVQYGTTPEVTQSVDDLQQKLKCCGLQNASDWLHSSWYTKSNKTGQTVPESCCRNKTEKCWKLGGENVFNIGCQTALIELVNKTLLIILLVAFGTIFFEMFLVICALCIYRHKNMSGGY